MEINKKTFDILELLSNNSNYSQREISNELGISVGTVNKYVAEMTQEGLVCDGKITKKGLNALEPYRVKRAVFIAAGFGSRLVPITLNTPKPLVRVNGKRIIDTLLDAVVAAGIEEIYIVRGYLGEQFDQLTYKYPMIKFIENPVYNEANNISSASCASYLLKNAYVLEGDLMLYNPKLIKKYQYHSNYLGIKCETTDDWCFKVNDKGIIKKMAIGGTKCYQMVGISYWNETDGAKLVGHIKSVYQSPGGKERYWDQVALEYFIDEYDVYVRECQFEDIVEIDTFNELKKLDKTYDL
ncbi:MAG: winged helix-turn-helix transcriptional regulator [Oscillospiraceae bacterium]|nr:winged helix-turn-helix transcriptional regulator [Candidatus Ruminococcus equi]